MEDTLPTEVPAWLTSWMERLEGKVDNLSTQIRTYNPAHCIEQDVILRRLQDESAARAGASKTVELSRGWILAFVAVATLVISVAVYVKA